MRVVEASTQTRDQTPINGERGNAEHRTQDAGDEVSWVRVGVVYKNRSERNFVERRGFLVSVARGGVFVYISY